MDIPAGFVPGAEGSGGDVIADAFGGLALEGVFPVVDDAGAVGGDMGEESTLEHLVDDELGAVFYEVCSVDEHDGGVAMVGFTDGLGAGFDLLADEVVAWGWGLGGFDQNILEFREATALGEGEGFDLGEVDGVGLGWHGDERGDYWPRMSFIRGRASRKSGMTISAPTPLSRWRFHSSILPEPLWASSLATATARPPTSLVFWIST
ncbi:MAG: hypothetical protein RI897_1434 [Verrucomicrobiota bacterium]